MTTDNASHDARQPNVGERLRQAREVAGLSVTEVADRQHLRPAIISAIESGDYGRIDSELFLKGYVRAYATHVGIDPESVIRQLDKELEPLRQEQKARVEASPLVDIERRKRRKRRIAKAVFTLLVLAALFYAGSLYLAEHNLGGSSTEAGTEDSAEVPAVDSNVDEKLVSADDPVADTEAGEIASSASNEIEVSSEGDVVSDIGDGEGDMIVEDNPPEVGEGVTSGAVVTDTDGIAVSEDTSVETAPETDTPVDPQVTTTPLPESEPASVVDSGGRLVMEFSEDCWVEVQDRNGRTLVAQLRRAGETLDVTGESPLRVVIGAVSAVSSVRYGGEPVDLTERRARNDRLVLNLSD